MIEYVPTGVGRARLPVVTSEVRTTLSPSYTVMRCWLNDTTIRL